MVFPTMETRRAALWDASTLSIYTALQPSISTRWTCQVDDVVLREDLVGDFAELKAESVFERLGILLYIIHADQRIQNPVYSCFIQIQAFAQFEKSHRAVLGKILDGLENTFRYLNWIFFFHIYIHSISMIS